MQALAAADGGVAEIQFNRKPSGVAAAGDLWAVGHRSFEGANGFLSIGCNLTNVTLSISPPGTVNVPHSLTIGDIAAQRIPYVSCRVDGTNVNNRGGQVVPTADVSQTGRTILTISPPHPASGLFNPQVTLISNWGYIWVDSPFTSGTLTVWTANSSLSFVTLSFFLLIF